MEPYGSENRNKKAPKPKALVQTHLCTRIRSAGKAGEKIGTEYPDSVCGAKARSFRKAFPAPASDRRACANRKEHTPYSAVSASGIHTPFLCTRAKVPVRALFLYAHILFWVKIILPTSYYTPLFYFVKALTLKGDNLHKFTHKMLFTLDL